MNHLDQDVDESNNETPTLGAVENSADEADILSDQDETQQSADLSANEDNMISEGTELKGPDDFARGEIDVKEQMDRTMAKMDADNHRPIDTPH